MLSLRKFFTLFFSLIIALWVTLSFFRTFYNVTKVIIQEKQWIFFSDQQKRQEIYGDIFPIYKKINPFISNNMPLYLVTNDGKAYFVLRYLLYPRKIYWQLLGQKLVDPSKHAFILYYHESLQNKKEYQEIFVFGQKDQQSFFYKQ